MTETTGYSRGWIQRLSQRYNRGGPAALGGSRCNHRNPGAGDRALLSTVQQRGPFEALLKEPPAADGGMWGSRKAADWTERKTGREERGEDAAAQLGAPTKVGSSLAEDSRPHHAKADAEEQEAFERSFTSEQRSSKRPTPKRRFSFGPRTSTA